MAELFRALMLYSGGPGFKASTLSVAGFVSRYPRSRFVNSQQVCLLPVGVFNSVTFS